MTSLTPLHEAIEEIDDEFTEYFVATGIEQVTEQQEKDLRDFIKKALTRIAALTRTAALEEAAGMCEVIRGNLERTAWKHYDPEASLNVEDMLDEMMPEIDAAIRSLITTDTDHHE